MPSQHPSNDEFRQRRLQRMQLRQRRAHFVLAGARAAYQALRERPGADELALRQALQRIERAQEQLLDVQSTLEYLEDEERVA